MSNNQWDTYADVFDEGIGSGGDTLHTKCIDPVLLRYVGDTTEKNVVDLGCGNGYFFHKLPAGTKYIGVDDSKELLAKASGRIQDLSTRFVQADIARGLSLGAGIADVVVCNMVLQYIPDLSGVRKNVFKILKNRGVFAISIDHPAHALFVRAQTLAGKADTKFLTSASYFTEGQRQKRSLWDKAVLTYYHRTVAAYVNAFSSQFRLDRMDEVSEDGETPRILGLKFIK